MGNSLVGNRDTVDQHNRPKRMHAAKVELVTLHWARGKEKLWRVQIMEMEMDGKSAAEEHFNKSIQKKQKVEQIKWLIYFHVIGRRQHLNTPSHTQTHIWCWTALVEPCSGLQCENSGSSSTFLLPLCFCTQDWSYHSFSATAITHAFFSTDQTHVKWLPLGRGGIFSGIRFTPGKKRCEQWVKMFMWIKITLSHKMLLTRFLYFPVLGSQSKVYCMGKKTLLLYLMCQYGLVYKCLCL